MRQIVSNAALALTLEAPMERQTDLVHDASVDAQWPQTARHHCAGLDFTTWRADDHPVTVLDAALICQFRAKFGKERGLKRVQPGHPACHRPANVMLGQAVGSNDDRIVLI